MAGIFCIRIPPILLIASGQSVFRRESFSLRGLCRAATGRRGGRCLDGQSLSPGQFAESEVQQFNCVGVSVCGARGSYVFTQDFASEAVSILSREVRRAADGGYELHLRARVCSGPREGAILLDGKRVANWSAAADGSFEVITALPGLGTVQIGQLVGPRSWEIETEFSAERAL